MAESVVISNSYIVRTPGICGGRARIDGTRIGVETIVGMYHSGATVEEIARGYEAAGVTVAKVHAALVYYYDHRSEVDAILEAYQEQSEAGRERDDDLRAAQGLPPAGEYITSREAADLLGAAHESRWVARLCRSGHLVCRKVGRDWLVSRKSAEEYARRHGASRPR
jgi:uncharacterized protein (DUF433 family)